MTLSSSQVDDLGERLRATDSPTAADRDLLAQLLASYAKPLEDARTRIVTGLARPGFVTGRLKSTPSIIDELRQYDFEVISTTLPEGQEQQLREAFAQE